MARQYTSSKNVTSITYWRKWAEHRLVYVILSLVFAVGIIAYFGMGQAPGGGARMPQTAGGQTIANVNGIDIPRTSYDRQWGQMRQFAGGNETQAATYQGMILN